jgi:hypothetical protein
MIAQVAIGKDFTKILPQENTSIILKSANSVPNNWKGFNIDNGKWFLSYDGITGLPSSAFGQPIKITGFNTIDESNIQAAVNKFLQQNKKYINIDPSTLSKRKLVQVKNTWAISFAQIHNDVEVLLTNVEFKIREDGYVISFSLKYYDNIEFASSQLISNEQAKASAIQGMSVKTSGNSLESDSKFYILPIINGNKTTFSLVYKYLVTDNSDITPSKWHSYVDAHSGDLIWRRPLIMDAENLIENSVKRTSAQDIEETVPLADCIVSLDNNTYTTDTQGKFSADLIEGKSFSFGFRGPWCNVDIYQMTQVPNSIITGSVKNTDLEGLKIITNANNSTPDERFLFYYTNKAHDYYKETDPVSKAMDFQCLVRTTYQGTPNASSDLQTGNILFTNTNNSSTRFVETPSVLYHEYGHSQNQRLYYEVGIAQGMINYSCHEALADLNSALILNESKIGLGAWVNNPTKHIRDINNHKKYPQDVNSDSHLTGLILAGAYWDLVKVLSTDTVRYIAHFTKKLGTPDDENVGAAFAKWFIETLTTDDVLYGDADLSNGTPHFQQILTAFNNHNIGTNLLLMNTFHHIQHEDTDDIENDYKINFHLGTEMSFMNSKPINVKLVYFLNNMNNRYETDAVEVSNLNWQAIIPAQPRGTVIFYYFTATEPITESNLQLYSNDEGEMFKFLVGYTTALEIDFDDNGAGWISGTPQDNSPTGVWQWGIPKAYYYYYAYYGTLLPLQSEGDHRPSGYATGNCWATGLDNGGDYTKMNFSYIPQGRTTLESPIYDISKLKNPIIDYWRWFTNISNLAKPAYWVVSLSNDEGNTWIQVDSTYQSVETIWENHRLYLNNYSNEFKSLKMRFIFYGLTPQQGLAEGALDDIKILSGNDEIVSSVNENISQNITTYPNPFVSDFTINYLSNQTAKSEISLYNIMGEKLTDLYIGYINEGVFSKTFNLSNYSPGLYFVRINCNGETSNIRIIKK